MTIRRKYLLAFNPESAKLPIIAILVQKFGIVPNIMQAKINEKGGRLVLDVEGEKDNLQRAKEYVLAHGIEMKELDKHVSRDEWRCINCGACVSICPAEAFHIESGTYKIGFSADKCIACEACIVACPPRAMKLELW